MFPALVALAALLHGGALQIVRAGRIALGGGTVGGRGAHARLLDLQRSGAAHPIVVSWNTRNLYEPSHSLSITSNLYTILKPYLNTLSTSA